MQSIKRQKERSIRADKVHNVKVTFVARTIAIGYRIHAKNMRTMNGMITKIIQGAKAINCVRIITAIFFQQIMIKDKVKTKDTIVLGDFPNMIINSDHKARIISIFETISSRKETTSMHIYFHNHTVAGMHHKKKEKIIMPRSGQIMTTIADGERALLHKIRYTNKAGLKILLVMTKQII